MFEKLLCKIFKRKFWYFAVLEYSTNDRTVLITGESIIGVSERNSIIGFRKLRKSLAPLFFKSFNKKYLQNGTLKLIQFSYLGWF